jgi:phage terminase Nu1 subunit (DNA packaging protein)
MLNVSTVEERQARIRKLNAEAEARELKNAQIRGELYAAEDVERDTAELTSLIRCRLESIPDELHTEWPLEFRQEVTQRMRDKIALILTSMAAWRLSSWDATKAGDSEPSTEGAETADSLVSDEYTDA